MGTGDWRAGNWSRLMASNIDLKIGRDGNFSGMESHVRNDKGLAVSGRFLQGRCIT